MNQIRPQSKIPIVRQLDDPSDAGTYYVRAFIRNSLTEDLIETIDLVDKGDRRFANTFLTPADYSGTGYHIDITTKVYSDSGYTTQDTIYADENVEYFVREMWNQAFGNGGGSDVDYKRLRAIIKDEIGKLPPSEIEFDLGPVLLEIGGIKQALQLIEFPKTDISPIFAAIDGLSSKISKINTKTDLSPVTSEIKKLSSILSGIKTIKKEDVKSEIQEEVSVVRSMIDNIIGLVTPKPEVKIEIDPSVKKKEVLKKRTSRLLGIPSGVNLARAKRLLI